MDILARKYLNGALGYSIYPHFVAAYTDYYGHVDYTGAEELSGEQIGRIRESYRTQAQAAAGLSGLERPFRWTFDRKRWPKALREAYDSQSRDARKAFDQVLKDRREQHGGDKKWSENHYKTGRRAACRPCQATALGVSPIPDPPRYIPLPQLDENNLERVDRQAAYDYASFMLRGTERIYGRITDQLETELPAIFTIHNKGTMNHASVSHAWTGFPYPNIDPAYLHGGATAISVSEWNLDSVPKPYFLTTFYNRPLVDRGHPVYRTGLWKQAGSPTRWMRDSVFWAGRQIHTYFDQAGNMTWSHQGSDQTTYASNERMSSVAEFWHGTPTWPALSQYAKSVCTCRRLAVVGHWRDAWPLRGMVASLMSDYQAWSAMAISLKAA